MTASEQLRALDEAIKDLLPTLNYYIGPGARTAVSRESVQIYFATKAVRNALPLIADVVEAAENAQAVAWLTRFGPGVKMARPREASLMNTLSTALAALTAALQPPTEGSPTVPGAPSALCEHVWKATLDGEWYACVLCGVLRSRGVDAPPEGATAP